MNRPTREQIKQARAWLRSNRSLVPDPRDLTAEGLDRTVEMIAVLLSTTSEPTEEELDAEAERCFPGSLAPSLLGRYAYIRGARREGAK